jgi:enoyl-[acyl-carrier-protein] reductase (NADH)
VRDEKADKQLVGAIAMGLVSDLARNVTGSTAYVDAGSCDFMSTRDTTAGRCRPLPQP